MNEIVSIDGQHTLTVGEWFSGSLPTDVVCLRVIEYAWDLDILGLHFDEHAAFQQARRMGTEALDDADLHLLNLCLMEAEKEFALLAPDGWEIGYDIDGSFGLWRTLEGAEEPPGHGYEAYSSFNQNEVIW